MSNFWPSDLDISDTVTPREILKTAKDDWLTGSNGVMDLVLQDAKSKSGNPIIIVHAKHVPSNRTVTIFTIIFRPNKPYPVTIELEQEDLPAFLKKSYSRPSAMDFTTAVLGAKGQAVSNPWVAETPAEFRKKLADALNSGAIKGQIINLLSDEAGDSGNASEDSQNEDGED
jgi:hypothetical protein